MSNIRLAIFDLDGVLVDSREEHFISLNKALEEISPDHIISKSDHLTKFDGLPTKAKLEILTKEYGLNVNLHQAIWKRKQEVTLEILKDLVKTDEKLISLFKKIKEKGIKICVASNSIRETVKIILLKKGVLEYIDYYVSNDDVKSFKPHPEMYWQCMIKEGVLPKETLIIEDSYVGRCAAISSGANLCPVKNPDEVTEERIFSYLNIENKSPKWVDKTMQVIIPLAGLGSRFSVAGYKFPKPLIDVKGKPMIQMVHDNLNVDAKFIYIVRKEHCEEYNLKSMLNIISPGCKIIEVDKTTEGAACTVLLAKEYINNNHPLLIANCDQYLVWNSGEFFHTMNSVNIDGGIITFKNTHPKWSYIKTDEYNNVTEVKEKEVISNDATIGVYYWSKGSDFVQSAETMISKNIRVNNEFYVAPTYNELIADGKKIKKYHIDKFFGTGTPEDLTEFLKQNYI